MPAISVLKDLIGDTLHFFEFLGCVSIASHLKKRPVSVGFRLVIYNVVAILALCDVV